MKSVIFVVFLFFYTFLNPFLLLAQDGFVFISDTLIHRIDHETKLPIDIKVGKFLIGKTEVTQVQFEEKIAYYNHHSGHSMTPQATYLGFEWLDHYLNNPKQWFLFDD